MDEQKLIWVCIFTYSPTQFTSFHKNPMLVFNMPSLPYGKVLMGGNMHENTDRLASAGGQISGV